MTLNPGHPKRFSFPVRLAALVAWAALAANSAAHDTGVPHTHDATDPTVTYHIDFSTDFNLMLDPNDPVAQHFAMWKTPTQMASLRSAPFLRVTNDSSSSMQLSNLRIDLGTQGYAFDSFAFFEQPNDGAAQVVSHTDLAFGGDMRPFLDIEFPSGLDPGDSFTFQVRLAKLTPPGLGESGLAGYEDVLWQQNNATSANRLDNALVTTTFRQNFSGQLVTVNMTPVRLFEYPLANMTFPVDPDGASGNIFVLPNNYEMIDVGFARFSQTVQIPEPSGLALAGIAAIGLVAGRRKLFRRSMRPAA